MVDGWRDPKTKRWIARDWSGFVPTPDQENKVSIIGPDIPGVDDEDRLFRWGDIPQIREKGRRGMQLYDMWKRFGLPFSGGWADQPQYVIDRLHIVDTIVRAAHAKR